MYVIGLTGGVGSGKSLVAEIISKKYNASLLIADELGHIVMEPGTSCFDKVVSRFGKDIVGEDGRINRRKVAEIIFGDDKALSDMNNIVHPEVMSYIERYIEDRKNEKGYIILETAIMYETGCDRFCDEVWYVYVPADIRIKRLSENRGYSYEKSQSIIGRQKSDEYFIEKSDRVIDNSGDIDTLYKKLTI